MLKRLLSVNRSHKHKDNSPESKVAGNGKPKRSSTISKRTAPRDHIPRAIPVDNFPKNGDNKQGVEDSQGNEPTVVRLDDLTGSSPGDSAAGGIPKEEIKLPQDLNVSYTFSTWSPATDQATAGSMPAQEINVTPPISSNTISLEPRVSKGLPFGDGSNKVFGYENFGNTCYCNSVLQCLYHLPEFRLRVLEYPEKPEEQERHRKRAMVGKHPRLFTRESFQTTDNLPKNAGKNSRSASSNSEDSNMGNGNAGEASSHHLHHFGNHYDNKNKRSSFISFGRHGSDNSKASKNEQAIEDDQKIEPVHSVIMAADNITEKLHEGCRTIIVGRKSLPSSIKLNSSWERENASSLEPRNNNGYSINSNSNSADPSAGANTAKSPIPADVYTSEQRKKNALITGPVLNIDHMVAVTAKPNLYNTLKEIFECITENENYTGVVSPTLFVKTLKKENVLFNTQMQQDAHEFLNFLLNDLNDYLQSRGQTYILNQFQGTVTNQIKCLTCDTITSSSEPFLDFPIEVEADEEKYIQNVMEHYQQRELLRGSNKFYCNECCGLQEAERLVGLKSLPKTLSLHLKRFKYSEEKNANVKLFNKIHYPLILNASSTFDSSVSKSYRLQGVVVHMGNGPHHGHYVSLCHTELFGWLLFDDETVESVDESYVLDFVGSHESPTTAYVLFYSEIDGSERAVQEIPAVYERDLFEATIKKLISLDNEVKRKQSEDKRQEEQNLAKARQALIQDADQAKGAGLRKGKPPAAPQGRSKSTSSKTFKRKSIMSFIKS
ncbi:uncharacterized protein KNAG_0C03580 [Huiozyma naganishii CBS 8797]|uniref:Ubiquitin carboxyl-terminal hydrolase n=1 Tax=Huiozyma naganishii (strain ATCC MYA-139 / BCRC 22969 / CBS 8797 / KCTC 17520 / NBRC 10181 / NCYC 3082 / Yp74L-3) TaxID=1071383 RepID=J7RWT5_HUIN7|nr:hypothetical protein KNAG_0C03580 [Kazachstania naganishii CBS 8797]CCK69462.1 hypothetical protein KNAG_0C03580 [Kazachstania naganishii CBS 8797]